MSKRKNTVKEVYVTVEPPAKNYFLLLFRVSNYFVLLSLLLLTKVSEVTVPESLVLLVGAAVVGVDLQQIIAIVSKFVKNDGVQKHG